MNNDEMKDIEVKSGKAQNDITELVFILDRSGSMSGKEKDTIGGFNSMIEKQKAEPGRAFVDTVLFDNEVTTIHDRAALEKVGLMTEKEYFVRGSTALLDAVGMTVSHIQNIYKYIRAEDVPSHTLVVIITDGMENASREYSYEKVKAMISEMKEKYGWEFIFIGANIDAAESAGRIGIDRHMAANYNCDGVGTASAFGAMNEAATTMRKCGIVGSGWSRSIDEDRAKRGKK